MTSTLTTVFSAFSSFGLIAVSAWFASERIIFNRHKGYKWLADIIDDVSEKIEKATGYKWVKKTASEKSKTVITWSARIVRCVMIPPTRMSAMFGRSSGSAGSADSVEPIPSPYTSPTILPSTGIMVPGTSPPSSIKPVVQFQLDRRDERNSGEASGRPSDASPVAPPLSPEPGEGVSVTRTRFMNLVRSAVMVNRLIGIGDEARAKVSSSLTDDKATDRKSVTAIIPRSSRVAGLVPRLQNMAPTQDIPAHAALVRHMQVSANQVVTFALVNHVPQFSPDGKFLATTSWDRTSVIFHVGVCLIDVSLRCVTKRLVRNNSILIACCCIPPDLLVKLHGESGSFGKYAP